MDGVKKIVLDKVIKQIEALELKYAIIDFDGNILGNLNIEKNKRVSKYGYGLLTNYVREYLQSLAIGDVAVVPWANFDAYDLSQAIAKFSYTKWGKGSFNYVTVKENQTVELLRVS